MSAIQMVEFDIAVVPFPFTDRATTKRRPALVLSSTTFNQGTGHAVMAMITSAEQSTWPGDVPIADLDAAGLPGDCVIRLKLFTLDQRLILKRVGRLAAGDRAQLADRWKPLLFG